MKRVALVVIVSGVVALGGVYLAVRFYGAHETYSVRDPRTGMQFRALCQYNEHSYRTYVEVRSPSGRLVSLQEIPYSADHLDDCLNRPYYRVEGIAADPSYTKLIVTFKDSRRVFVLVPLALHELDGIKLPADRPPARY